MRPLVVPRHGSAVTPPPRRVAEAKRVPPLSTPASGRLPLRAWRACPAAGALGPETADSGPPAIDEVAAKALAHRSNRLRCHGVTKPKEGPPYAEVAAEYRAGPPRAVDPGAVNRPLRSRR